LNKFNYIVFEAQQREDIICDLFRPLPGGVGTGTAPGRKVPKRIRLSVTEKFKNSGRCQQKVKSVRCTEHMSPMGEKKKTAKMVPRFAPFFLSFTAYLSVPATAQLITSTTSARPEPQHTAIYTTILRNYEAITTVVVTLLMPRHHTGFPKDGTPVTGTAISRLSAAQRGGGMSTWSKTAELYWTLTGNSDSRWPDTKRQG
jgi:hypothetical protein